MNRLRMIALMCLLSAGRAGAGALADTNHMPPSVHALMETSGHALVPTNLVLVPPDSNSLRILPPIEKKRLMVFKPPPPKSIWSFWNNTGVKYIRRNRDPLNILEPAQMTVYSALAQFEYDVTYSFDF